MITQETLKGLTSLRESLEEATEGYSLMDATVNPALLLYDVCQALGLFDDQIEQVLGTELVREIENFLDAPLMLDIESLPVVA
jgi:hypothetical protein